MERQLGGEYPNIATASLSALFNAILFVRAAEDQRRQSNGNGNTQLLPSIAERVGNGSVVLRSIVLSALDELRVSHLPAGLIEIEALSVFDSLDRSLMLELLGDFYRNRFARFYEYDFSLMSKHALSRIYEHYVSVLRIPTGNQLSFLPTMATETLDRGFGNIYTPEFIAKFFARYLRAHLPLRTFQ